jgi:hypothetical protein
MFKSLLRFLGVVKDEKRSEKYDRIYGYPPRAIDEWLSYNPVLKKSYEAKLRIGRGGDGRLVSR